MKISLSKSPPCPLSNLGALHTRHKHGMLCVYKRNASSMRDMRASHTHTINCKINMFHVCVTCIHSVVSCVVCRVSCVVFCSVLFCSDMSCHVMSYVYMYTSTNIYIYKVLWTFPYISTRCKISVIMITFSYKNYKMLLTFYVSAIILTV